MEEVKDGPSVRIVSLLVYIFCQRCRSLGVFHSIWHKVYRGTLTRQDNKFILLICNKVSKHMCQTGVFPYISGWMNPQKREDIDFQSGIPRNWIMLFLFPRFSSFELKESFSIFKLNYRQPRYNFKGLFYINIERHSRVYRITFTMLFFYFERSSVMFYEFFTSNLCKSEVNPCF